MIKRSLLIIFISTLYINAQDSTLLTINRIFEKREFRTERFGPARWLDNDSGYTTLEKAEGFDTREIVVYNSGTGHRSVMVSAARLIPAGQSTPLTISNYEWSPNKKYLLIFTNTKRVWRTNTRGDYWILDLQNNELHKLGKDFKSSSLMFAKFSPDNNRVAYVYERNIYIEYLDSGRILQLTQDGSDIIINGTSDWVYEEEFRLRDGFIWSPDGSKIAFWQFNTKGIGIFNMINNTDSIYSKIIPLQYPKVGTINSACRVGVVSAKGGNTTWFMVEGDPRNNYIPRMKWAANSDEVVIQQLNRLQNTLNIIIGNAVSGKVKTIYVEKDDAYIEVRQDYLKWFKDGKYFTWLSDMDGWQHVYLISRDGQEIINLTPGEFDVVSIAKIDNENGWVYYIASPENASERYLYRAPFDGSGKCERITPEGIHGYHAYQISNTGRWAFHSYSNFDTPPVTEQISLPNHNSIRVLVDNQKIKQKVTALSKYQVEFFNIRIDENIDLDAWMMKPYNFDPRKKYPLFFFVYGEPGGQRVRNYWYGSRYLWHLMLTQLGYVVACVDNRGTPGPKGRAWRKAAYRQVGILAPEDQAKAATVLLKNRSYLDADRVGIWGWSGGGSMTLNAMFKYPDIYKTGIAISFVSDQRFYDTIYQERYMGLPSDNAKGFKNGSPVNFAHQLQGNLLIIHGTGDDNVHYQNFEYLVNALIRHKKHFSMMSYPNRSHGIWEGENTTVHLYNLMLDYLKKNLTPGPK